jgi:heat shock protein HslJ
MRSRMIAAAVALALVAAALASVGCTAGGGGSATLDGTSWRLTEWTLDSIDPSTVTITAQFAGGRIGGTSAVNSYGGPYTLGPGTAFSVGELVSTLMAGPEPQMRAEQAYTTLLRAARSYGLKGDTLTLYDAGGNESLIFTRAAK